ncbi:hypothetical protein GCM10007079_18670 [Nocardiopsis terrae]|uniref:Uncharacterized protein n=1 Tax=Nocardiopsis terrae TaxID=372655 RepID=A0ABR9HHK7_9ACTN|nr:hypothetical protein [Nocardiopsis terrae]MBE1458510.1 hypothetical protein [Nocardiopsis terrae]GHC80011.1 hypothetical protein GCM10007079_18670 [Nocardiopsis terrae]
MPTELRNAPTPTEVIAAWIPHDARWNAQARQAARAGVEALRRYVTGLITHHRDGGLLVDDDFDLRSIAAVVEDLEEGGLFRVRWDQAQDALLVPDRAGVR